MDTDSYDDVYAEMDRIMEQLRTQGHTPYAIPVGARSRWAVLATSTARRKLQKLDVAFDAVVSAAGSGGTYAGLTLGAKLFLPGIRSIGRHWYLR